MAMAEPIRIRVGQTTLTAYKRRDGRFSLVYMFQGRRKYETFKDEKTVRDRAKQLAEATNANKVGEHRLTGNKLADYVASTSAAEHAGVSLVTAVAEYVEARKRLKETGVSVVAAAAEYAEAKKRAQGQSLIEAAEFFAQNHDLNLPQRTIAGIIPDFIEAKRADCRSEQYLVTLRSELKKAAAYFTQPIGDITTANLDDWLRSQKDVTPRTRLNMRRTLVTLFSFAKLRGYLARDRQTAAELTARPKVVDGETEIYTPREMMALMKAANETAIPVLVLGGFAGLRTAEILRLKWENVSFEQQHIKISAHVAKTASRRIVPLLPNAVTWLSPWCNASGPIFSGSRQRLSETLRKVASRAKLKWRRNALRHSFASYRLIQIKNAAQLTLEMGNTQDIMFKNYNEPVTESDAKAWFSIAPNRAANVVPMSKHKAASA